MLTINRFLIPILSFLVDPVAVWAFHVMLSTVCGVVRSSACSTGRFITALALAVSETIALEAPNHHDPIFDRAKWVANAYPLQRRQFLKQFWFNIGDHKFGAETVDLFKLDIEFAFSKLLQSIILRQNKVINLFLWNTFINSQNLNLWVPFSRHEGFNIVVICHHSTQSPTLAFGVTWQDNPIFRSHLFAFDSYPNERSPRSGRSEWGSMTWLENALANSTRTG